MVKVVVMLLTALRGLTAKVTELFTISRFLHIYVE